ncbi:pyruvate ferredoxin oxidoreductase [Candidatus Micrarchaeota archaeon]|nr:pyruvate ferredoxin oxidoreductase [Candidatus Micrarchaeota archaeon]
MVNERFIGGKKTIEGSIAVAETVINSEPDVIACFPITPSTHIAEHLDKAYTNGRVKSFVAVDSEFAAISTIVGASAAGARAFSTTSSQGLALMHEVLFAAAGLRLPLVMVVANRSLSAPLSIWNDHQDTMSERDSGWIQFYCESNQEVVDTIPLAYKVAEENQLPAMVCMDGFYLTHAVEQIIIPNHDDIIGFIGKYNPKIKLDPDNPVAMGVYAKPEHYQAFRVNLDRDMFKVKSSIVKHTNDWYGKLNRVHDNGLFEDYYASDADYVLIAVSSVCGNIKETVDKLREKGERVGLLRIKTFRPFPYKEVFDVIKNSRSVGVFEKSLSMGAYTPIYQDVLTSLNISSDDKRDIPLSSFIGGLGGRDIIEEHIIEMFKQIRKEKPIRDYVW